MNIKNTYLPTFMASMLFLSPSLQAESPLQYFQYFRYLWMTIGTVGVGYSGFMLAQGEDGLVQSEANKLYKKIEEQRKLIRVRIERLQQELQKLHASSTYNGTVSEQEKKLQQALAQAEEQERLITFDYEIEYARIRPRVRFWREEALGGLVGGIFMLVVGYTLMGKLEHEFLKEQAYL